MKEHSSWRFGTCALLQPLFYSVTCFSLASHHHTASAWVTGNFLCDLWWRSWHHWSPFLSQLLWFLLHIHPTRPPPPFRLWDCSAQAPLCRILSSCWSAMSDPALFWSLVEECFLRYCERLTTAYRWCIRKDFSYFLATFSAIFLLLIHLENNFTPII